MSVSYQTILHDVAIRMRALVGTQVLNIATTYDTGTLTSAHFKSADWPFNSFRDAILMAEAELAAAIAMTGNHPWRAYYAGITNTLTNGAQLPSTDSLNAPIIGVWGTVYDANSTARPCTEQPLEVIRRINQETDWRRYPLYYFKIDGQLIFHTVPAGVKIDVCAYNRATRLAAWPAGNISLPDVLEATLVARAISLMTKDNAFVEQAKIYRDYSDVAITAIRSGLTSVPAKTIPAPTLQPTAA